MARRCQFGPHATCAICSAPIIGAYDHVHNYNRKRGADEVWCTECTHRVIVSSGIVIAALAAIDYQGTAQDLQELYSGGGVGVLVQADLWSHAPSRN